MSPIIVGLVLCAERKVANRVEFKLVIRRVTFAWNIKVENRH
jgi:hypothetical protein